MKLLTPKIFSSKFIAPKLMVNNVSGTIKVHEKRLRLLEIHAPVNYNKMQNW